MQKRFANYRTHANVVDNCDQLEKMMKQVSMQKFEKLFYPDDVAPKDFERLKLVGEGGYGKVRYFIALWASTSFNSEDVLLSSLWKPSSWLKIEHLKIPAMVQ